MIYKYTLSAVKPTVLELSRNSQVLSIQRQDADIVVWIDVDFDNEPLAITFTPVMTGCEPPAGFYVGTVQTPDGFVIHYYV